jgi:hypothetical protein
MPNYVTNTVSFITKDVKEINKILDFVKSDTNEIFDFNKIIPMPKELDIPASSVTDLSKSIQECIELKDNIKLSEILDDNRLDFILGTEIPRDIHTSLAKLKEEKLYDEEIGKIAYNNYKKYGYTDWYGWCIENWDTKWNCMYCTIEYDNDIFKYLKFDTAWDIPYKIFLKLSKIFPNIGILVESEFECDDDLIIKNIYHNGELIEDPNEVEKIKSTYKI